MKAVLVRDFAPFEEIGVEEVDDPVAGPGEVVLDVAAVEANYPDILAIEGRYQFKPPLPFSPGKAAAGRIAAIGPGVEGLGIGDGVIAQVEYGAYAEKLKARAEHCFATPEGLAFDKAAALGLVYQTAWFALKERASFAPGDNVLVLGASGGVGLASVQLARAFGAGRVIAGTRDMANAALLRQVGADVAVDLGRDDLRDGLRDAVKEATGGHGADIVIDPVGGEASTAALRAMAWCGRLVVVGFASGEIPAFRANHLLVKNISVSGLQWSDYRDRAPSLMRKAQEEIFALHMAGRLDPHISRRLPLAEFKQALRALQGGRAQGKIVLEMRPS